MEEKDEGETRDQGFQASYFIRCYSAVRDEQCSCSPAIMPHGLLVPASLYLKATSHCSMPIVHGWVTQRLVTWTRNGRGMAESSIVSLSRAKGGVALLPRGDRRVESVEVNGRRQAQSLVQHVLTVEEIEILLCCNLIVQNRKRDVTITGDLTRDINGRCMAKAGRVY